MAHRVLLLCVGPFSDTMLPLAGFLMVLHVFFNHWLREPCVIGRPVCF